MVDISNIMALKYCLKYPMVAFAKNEFNFNEYIQVFYSQRITLLYGVIFSTFALGLAVSYINILVCYYSKYMN